MERRLGFVDFWVFVVWRLFSTTPEDKQVMNLKRESKGEIAKKDRWRVVVSKAVHVDNDCDGQDKQKSFSQTIPI